MTDTTGVLGGRSLDDWARIGILGLSLVVGCALGLVTPYLIVLIGIVLAVRMAMARELVAAYREPTALIFVLAFAVLGTCYAITAQAPGDVLFVFNFSMLLLYAPIRAHLAKAAAPGNARRFANLCAAGTGVALAVTLFRLFVLNEPRADSLMFGAILMGNTAILLGFLSVIGVMTPGRWRWAYLIPPVVGIGVAILTGSRGPMIAIIPLIIVTAIFLARHLRVPAWQAGLGVLIVVIAGGIGLWLMQGRAASIFQALIEAGQAGPVTGATDFTTRVRIDLYVGGYRAFLDNPIFGHGWARLVAAVNPYLPSLEWPYADLHQLHNDIVNLAVAAGSFGLLTYLALLAAPLVGILRTPRDGQFEARLFGGVVLVVAYFCDGLTDLMLGFEFHTAMFACVTAVLIGYCRDVVVTR